MKPTLSFIGAGKVGQTLAVLWQRAGYSIQSVYSPTKAHAQQLAERVGAAVADSPQEAASAAEIVFLTVPDDAIAPVAAELVTVGWQGQGVVHTSGAASLDKLEVLAAVGARTGSLHPAFPFAKVEEAVRELPGAAFATESSHEKLGSQLSELVAALNGTEIVIPQGGKAAYHAALVMASNYTVTLYAVAERMLAALGADKEASATALNALMLGTVKNLVQVGTPWGLTGPLTRADGGTIEAHLQAIDDDEIRAAYVQLARLTMPMLRERGVPLAQLEKTLQDHE